MKDPVILWHDGLWHMWLCCHPLEDPSATDRMWTRYGTSTDGMAWDLHGTALGPTPGQWDARGARVTYVMVDEGRWRAYYDGRATAEDNAEELTGVAVGTLTYAPGEVGPAFSFDGSSGYVRIPASPTLNAGLLRSCA